MKVNKKSWHYTVAKFVFSEYKLSNSLCVYFWQVVWAILVNIAGAVLSIGLLLIWLFFLFIAPFVHGSEIGSMIIWIVTGTFIRESAVIYLKTNYPNSFLLRKVSISKFLQKSDENGLTEPKEPSIVVSYIKAKKEKICPVIEFVDND